MSLVPSVDPADPTTLVRGPQEGENAYRWAAVTQLDPLRIVLDGEDIPLPITPESLVDPQTLRVDTRVWVQLFGRRVIVLGASSGGADIFTPIGTVLQFAGSTAPDNWLLCDGSAVSRTTYADLFAVCGTTYGSGDGSTTFNVPDLTDRVPAGAGGAYSRGGTGGAATHVLTQAELPAHIHTGSSLTVSTITGHTHTQQGSTTSDNSHSHTTGLPSAGPGGVVATGGTSYAQVGSGSTGTAAAHSHTMQGSTGVGGSHAHTLSGSTGSVGSGTAHENMPPYLALNYIIRSS